MDKIFDDITITNPEHTPYNSYYTVPLSQAQAKGWFISEVFGSFAWIIKKYKKVFKSRCVNIVFNCDRELAEQKLNTIAKQKYQMYQRLLKGKKYESRTW